MKIAIRYTKGQESSFQIIEEKDYRRVKLSLEKLGYEVSKEEKKV